MIYIIIYIKITLEKKMIRKDYMNYIKNLILKYKYYLIFIFVFIIILILFFINNNADDVEAVESENIIAENKVKEKKEEVLEKRIKVDIKGEVVNPGVYELTDSQRVIDVINEAGGLNKNADTSYLNLSKKLIDEMTIIVYSKEQIENFKNNDPVIVYVEKECNCPDISNDACIVKSESNADQGKITDKININKASIEELQSLTGIGKSKAESIIKYREENGDFENIEDIMNVSGIGESAYSKIKDNITI